MPKAIWNGAVLAESDRCEVAEGNQYFPPDSISQEFSQEYFKLSLNRAISIPLVVGKGSLVITTLKLMVK